MVRKLPPLTSLPAFEATARLGSMKAAGEELGRTHGAISKQIGILTEDLGFSLFEKKGVGVELTPDGRELAEAVGAALDQMDEACKRLRLKHRGLGLVIAVSSTFAMRWLMPRLSGFYQQVPGVEISFKMHGRHRPAESDVDIILTWDRLQWEFDDNPKLQKLADVAFGPVHAPGIKVTGSDGVYECETRFLQEIAPHTWTIWEQLSGIRLTSGRLTQYPHTFLAIEAAVAGHGLALVERRLVEADLASGKLEAPFGFTEVKDGFGAIVPDHARKRAIVADFLDWIAKEARAG